MWQMSMWHLVVMGERSKNLNVMHQREHYIIIQTLMEKLMENTREAVSLSERVNINRVVQSIKQMLRMIFMMDL